MLTVFNSAVLVGVTVLGYSPHQRFPDGGSGGMEGGGGRRWGDGEVGRWGGGACLPHAHYPPLVCFLLREPVPVFRPFLKIRALFTYLLRRKHSSCALETKPLSGVRPANVFSPSVAFSMVLMVFFMEKFLRLIKSNGSFFFFCSFMNEFCDLRNRCLPQCRGDLLPPRLPPEVL